MTTSSLGLSGQLLIGELVKRAAHKSPKQDAFICGDNRLTYEELDKRTTKLAGWLQSEGISLNDKVGFMLRNSIEFVEIVYGTALAGGVSVPINFRLRPSEVEYIVNNSDSKILILGEEFVELIESIKDSLPKVEQFIVVNNECTTKNGDFIDYNTIFEMNSRYIPFEELSDSDEVMIVYTSGTTGKPKGAVLTHKNLFMNAFNIMFEERDENKVQRQLAVVPLFHIGGITYIIKNCLSNSTTIIQEDYVPEDVLETIGKEKITTLGLVPTMWNFLLKSSDIGNYDLSSVTICTSGGSLLPLKLKRKIQKHFTKSSLIDTFGQTETSQSTTYSIGDEVITKPKSVGKSIINVEIRIVDENMNDVEVGVIGEIVYRGPTIMKDR